MTEFIIIGIIIFILIIGIDIIITCYTNKQQNKLDKINEKEYNNLSPEEKYRIKMINQNNKLNNKITIIIILMSIPYIIALLKLGTIIKILTTIVNN
jgi:hypothetical protein